MLRPLLASLLASVAALSAPPSTASAVEDPLLPDEQLGEILDADLSVQQWEIHSPNGPSQTTPAECRTMSNSTTTLVYGATWTNYEGASYADGEGNEYGTVVGQIVGVFPTAKAASGVFATLVRGLRSCGSKTSVEHRARGNLTWRNTVDRIAPSTASWHSLLDSEPSWRCSLQARLNGKAVMEASVCRFVAPASAQQADALSSQVAQIAQALADRTA